MDTTVNQSTKTGSRVQVRCIDSPQDLEPLRQQLDKLSDNPFLKTTWMLPWIETMCCDSCTLHFLVVENQQVDGLNQIIGFAPLVLRNSLKRGRHLTFVGSGKTCADYMTFPALPGFEEEANAAIAAWLNENDSHWDRIELDGVATQDSATANFCDLMVGHGCDVNPIETLSSFRMQMPQSWDEFLSTLSKNSRKKFRRQAKALDGHSTLHQKNWSKAIFR